jgi:glycosyltransferase involved in cell wall biosynthesis
VVGTRAGGIPEAVLPGKTGLLVDPGDPETLAHAIVTLLKDREMREVLGAAGRERVREKFGVDRLVEGTLAAYQRFAGRPATALT